MTHAPETGAENRLQFSGAGFWKVRHANLGLDGSGTRNRRRIEHCSIPSQKPACTWLKWCCISVYSLFLSFPVSKVKIVLLEFIYLQLITVYVAFSHLYFQHQKFSFQTYEKPAPKTGARKWSRWFLERVVGIRSAELVETCD